ncbi:MAG: PspA/IM30 family protein [Pseudomonadota bacterium]|nr:PspA/IM30 family protein [Pseudomonadota bacterium]
MLRVAVQVKELISSNVTSVMESASNPAKMLYRLQREIEEAIISLEGERTKTAQRKKRLEAQLTQQELRVADWADKAQTAMDHSREDLARQALIARDECRATIDAVKADIEAAENDLAEIENAISELEAKREDAKAKAREQVAADGSVSSTCASGGSASRTERAMGRISEMEKRTAFATEDYEEMRSHASVDAEIAKMRQSKAIDDEIAAMKSTPKKKAAPKKSAAKKA